MIPDDPVLVILRERLAYLLLGTIFLFVGLVACGIAVVRRRQESRVLVWFGLFIGMFGTRMLADTALALQLLPRSLWPDRIVIGVDYMLVIPAMLFWIELSTGGLRRVFQLLTVFAVGIATLGLGSFLIAGSPYRFMRYSSMLAICMILVVGVLVAVPRVTRKYLIIQSLALRIVMPALALVTLYVNIKWFFGYPPAPYIEPIAFTAWISAIGYEAAKHTFDNERRLFSIESELETARQIQSSILPDRIPTVVGLNISASYIPMSSVAGDYYQFLQVDDHRVGILVADVSGHGVPAALIASMIKVAMQSISVMAADPAMALSNLNRILTPELQGRLTSAAYLWIDTESQCVRYSAAGHPALLQWRAASSELLQIESNGLLFGVASESEYPVRTLALNSGDRFLLYTDGLVEPENTNSEAFGDRQLERVISVSSSLQAIELSRKLLSALRVWQPDKKAQKDDFTLIVVDIL